MGKGLSSEMENPQNCTEYIWHVCVRKLVPSLLKGNKKCHSHSGEQLGNMK